MVFTASVFCREELLAKRLTIDVAKAMSGLVSISKNINDPVMLSHCSHSAFMASDPLFWRIMAFIIKVLHGLARLRWYFEKILSM